VRPQFDTRGFAACLLAKPLGWEIRAGALPYLLKKEYGPGEHIGRDKVRRFFRELEAAGYVTRRRMRKADGQWQWQIEFTDTPPTTPTRPGTVDGSAVDGSATGGTAVDGSGVDLLQTLNHPKLDQCKSTTTAACQDDTGFGADQRGQLRYSDCLRSMPGDSRSKLLAACPGDLRQAVLDEIDEVDEVDEIDAMHKAGKVRNPIGLLSVLARKAGLGQFAPNYSMRFDTPRPVAERRGEARGTQRNLLRAVHYRARRSMIENLRKLCRLVHREIASGWHLSATTLARISVVTQFPDMAEEEAAAVLREAKALCTVTNTLSNAAAILYTAASGQASGQGVDFDVEGRFSRR
jgi:hypothetical protein